MSALAASLLALFVTAVLAILGTYYTARRNLQTEFDTSLRDLRIAAYKSSGSSSGSWGSTTGPRR